MTLALMKAFGPHFSTLIFALPILAMAATAHAGSDSCAGKTAAPPPDEVAAMAYPTFCSIPKRPTDVRAPTAFKAAVLDVRRSGIALVRASGPDSFGLPASGAAAFADQARAEATPPAPMNPQNVADAAAFAREARAQATPPTRPH
jgi:hypothetical protein